MAVEQAQRLVHRILLLAIVHYGLVWVAALDPHVGVWLLPYKLAAVAITLMLVTDLLLMRTSILAPLGSSSLLPPLTPRGAAFPAGLSASTTWNCTASLALLESAWATPTSTAWGGRYRNLSALGGEG